MIYRVISFTLLIGLFFIGSLAWAQDPSTTHAASSMYTLPTILDLALKRNPVMAAEQGSLAQKRGQQLTAKAYPNPTLTVHSGRGKIRDPSNGRSLLERSVTMSQQLEWPLMRAARQKAAEAGVQEGRAAIELTKLNLTADVKKAFFALLLAQTKNDLSNKILTTVHELSRAVRRRVEAGEAPPFEAVKVQVESLQVQKEVRRTLGTLRAAQASLNAITAGALGPDFSIQGKFWAWPKDRHVDDVSNQSVQHHPLITKLKMLVGEARQRHIQEQQARVPTFTMSGSFQRDAGRQGFVGGLSVPLPLWSLREGKIAQALGAQRQAEANLLHARNNLVKRITQNFQLSRAAAGQITTYEEGLLKQAREAMRIAKVSFRFGESSLLEVLDAQRVLWQTLSGYAQARYDLSVALAELERSAGKL